MRVFLSEYITSGALAEQPLPPTLRREGLAMRNALADDLRSLPNSVVCLTCDPRVPTVEGIEARVAKSSAEEREAFTQLSATCDATLIIAPETGGVLLERCTAAARLSPRLLNGTPEAVALCSDKLALARRLDAAGVPTLPTQRLDDPAAQREYPLVVKPQDGAGSQLTFRCRDAADLRARRGEFEAAGPAVVPIVQPYVAGRALSIAAMFSPDGAAALWPIAAQHLTADGTFQYLGGTLPVDDCDTAAIERLVRSTAIVVPGLCGYVGFDVLVPNAAPHQPLLVEINPRLTTSYVGYRRLARSNLARHWFESQPTAPDWRNVTIEYTADGVCTECRGMARSSHDSDGGARTTFPGPLGRG